MIDPHNTLVMSLLARQMGRPEDRETAQAIVDTARKYEKPRVVV
jgi:hypothetical protein